MINLGRKIRTRKAFQDVYRYYPAGSVGRLISIQSGPHSTAYATVVLDDDKTESEENFAFDQLVPI